MRYFNVVRKLNHITPQLMGQRTFSSNGKKKSSSNGKKKLPDALHSVMLLCRQHPIPVTLIAMTTLGVTGFAIYRLTKQGSTITYLGGSYTRQPEPIHEHKQGVVDTKVEGSIEQTQNTKSPASASQEVKGSEIKGTVKQEMTDDRRSLRPG